MKHGRKLFRWMKEWLTANGYKWWEWHYVKNTESEVVYVHVDGYATMTIHKVRRDRNEHKKRSKRSSAAGSNL